MANIYDQDGNYLTQGLPSDSVCSEAWQAAKSYAAERGEFVDLEDGDEWHRFFPDGRVIEIDAPPPETY